MTVNINSSAGIAATRGEEAREREEEEGKAGIKKDMDKPQSLSPRK